MVHLLLAAVLLTVLAPAAAGGAEPAAAAPRYTACLARTEVEPKEAFEDAIQWRDEGGGPPAEHCAAQALVALGLYADAAGRLEALAQRIKEDARFKGLILGQAGQAWLLADNPGRAEAVATAALALRPADMELYIDRAQARAQLGDFTLAVADLDAALDMNSGRPDVLAMRASAKRYLDDVAGALADAERAVALDPGHPEALLERGNLRRLEGDTAGARADWLQVLSVAPDTAAADAARKNIEKMDVNTN